MVIVRIFGGLGNQLFEYAFGRALSLKKNTPLLLDYYDQISRIDLNGEKLTKITNAFDLPVKLYAGKKRKELIRRYNLDYIDRLIKWTYLKTKCVIGEDNYEHLQKKIKKYQNIYFVGYWQGEHYFDEFKDVIKNDFKFKIERQISNLEIYGEITESDSVSLHVRGGEDYTNNSFYRKLNVKYYLDAVKIISKTNSKLKTFVFTDNIDNVHRNYKELLKFSKIVNVQTAFRSDIVDLLLMSKCKHNIIANSTFSWWGAWLNNNPNKIVVTPKKWFNDESLKYYNEKMLPATWHKI